MPTIKRFKNKGQINYYVNGKRYSLAKLLTKPELQDIVKQIADHENTLAEEATVAEAKYINKQSKLNLD